MPTLNCSTSHFFEFWAALTLLYFRLANPKQYPFLNQQTGKEIDYFEKSPEWLLIQKQTDSTQNYVTQLTCQNLPEVARGVHRPHLRRRRIYHVHLLVLHVHVQQ